MKLKNKKEIQASQVFKNPALGQVRTCISEDGELLFAATDVALALCYADPHKAIKAHCKKDGWAFCPVVDQEGKTRYAKFLSESNLYRLIMHCKLPEAEAFQDWIFEEVLPSLRKYQTYTIPHSFLVDKDELINLLDLCQKSSALVVTVINNDKKIKIQATPNGIDINCTQELNSTDTAKRYNQSAQWLNNLLLRNGVHRRIDGIWQFETQYANQGYATIDRNGTKCWTPKGRKLIDDFAKAEGIFPIE